MSIIGNNHSFVPFISGKSAAVEGQHLVVVSFKGSTDKKTGKYTPPKFDSVCASVPKIDCSIEQFQVIKGHVIAMLQEAQKGICKELVMAGKTSVSSDQINFQECADWLDSEAEGTRLQKDDVIQWFNESMADTLTVALADALGLPNELSEEQAKKLEQTVNAYRETIATMAVGKKPLKQEKAEKVKARIVECTDSENDEMAIRFIKKLDKMIEDSSADLI